MLAASYHGGLWDTGQFRSSTATTTRGLGWTDDAAGKVTVAYALYGDSNLDGTVNGADLNTVLSNYNKTGDYWYQGDFNYDGTVNGADLNTVLSNYNQSLSVGAAVPEPSTLGMLTLGVLAPTGLERLAEAKIEAETGGAAVVLPPRGFGLLPFRRLCLAAPRFWPPHVPDTHFQFRRR